MRLELFYKSFNLYDIDIEKIYTKEDKLYILLDLSAHLDLMGNGIRPEFNVSHKHMFIFNNNGYKLRMKNVIVNKYEFEDNRIILEANNKRIILDSDPEIIENYER